MEGTHAISLAPLSPARLQALAAEAWPLLPVPPGERKYLLRDEAAEIVDRLLVQVARGSGAIAVAMGEGMACLCSGDGTMRLGYSGIADYARENLSIAGRTALDMMKLARELRSRPLLREAVRSGEVSTEKARAVLSRAVGDAEAEWVARARRETVGALKRMAGGGKETEEREPWERMRLEVPPPDRKDVDEALELAGKKLGQASPRWQRVEAVSQEYLGGHPVEPIEDPPPDEQQGVIDAFNARLRPATALDAWLEAETDRWSFLH